MNRTVEKIREALKAAADEKTRISGERFFREEVKIYGVKTDTVGHIAKDHFKNLEKQDKDFVFGCCVDLFGSGIMEEAFVACNWSWFVHKQYLRNDMQIFDRWVNRFVTNWAVCDTLCNHSVGTLVEMYPELVTELKKWARSPNMWVKRASAVTLIIPARHGLFLNDIFEIADILLNDKADLVQKGYGWMLKAASQAHMNEVFGFVMQRKSGMPRTALRYAIEKMPADLKAAAMKK